MIFTKNAGISLLSSALGFLFLLVIFLYKRENQNGEYQIEEKQLFRFLRSTENGANTSERHHYEQMIEFVDSTFPWLIQNNTLMNYFIYGGGIQQERGDYTNGAIVFLHQHRSAGTAFINCLSNISNSHHFLQSSSFTSDRRNSWESLSRNDLAKIKMLLGQFSFGLCGRHEMTCSYFTIFRDPFERAFSSYEYCKIASADEMCKIVNANTVSLKQWILLQGSTTFQSLTFHSKRCQSRDIDNNQSPCWFHHKQKMDLLPKEKRQFLLEYILANLDKWFATIGLVEEIPKTLQMLEESYKLPFTQCSNFYWNTKENLNTSSNRKYKSTSKRNFYQYNYKNDKSDGYNNIANRNVISNNRNNDKENLFHDSEVRIALQEDLKIYIKAREIFKSQERILFNRL